MAQVYSTASFKYLVLPAESLKEPICRWAMQHTSQGNVSDQPETTPKFHTYWPPYPNLGPIESTVFPHLAVWNAVRKLPDDMAVVKKLSTTMDEIAKRHPQHLSLGMLHDIIKLCEFWQNLSL